MGPLSGIKVVEFVGIGPGPFAAMLLADMGAEVIRIDRRVPSDLGIKRPTRFDLSARGRRSVAIDLKQADGVALALDLVARADALIEGFRPGTMEKLGLGYDACRARNAALVYGRMTGWGQDGPLAQRAGHDLGYIALTGALAATGRAGAPPTPPLNLVGDYGGGALYLAFGMVCALLEARRSGEGQVVDAAIVDGAAHLMTPFFGLHAAGLWSATRGDNLLDSGAPNYDVYVCADGEYLAVAPIEHKFFRVLLERIGADPALADAARDRAQWPAVKATLTKIFAARPRGEWDRVLADSDACAAPVLSLAEAPAHPHLAARKTFVTIDGVTQPAPAPRFSRSLPDTPTPPEAPGASTQTVLRAWGIATGRIETLTQRGIIGRAAPNT